MPTVTTENDGRRDREPAAIFVGLSPAACGAGSDRVCSRELKRREGPGKIGIKVGVTRLTTRSQKNVNPTRKF